MSFQIIKGKYYVTGYSPDGDSIRFKADNLKNWSYLSGVNVKLNKKEHAQLRIEAIDTLETHYKQEHQPKEYADLATNKLLELLGIDDVIWDSKYKKIESANDGVDGSIICRKTDKYGRPIAFIYNSENNLNEEEIYVENDLIEKSINFELLKQGFAYPTFYDGLFYDIRELLRKVAKVARQEKRGIWNIDKTNTYLDIVDITDVTEKNVILPKIFRRIVEYIKDNGDFNVYDFKDKMEEMAEKILLLETEKFTHFDNIFDINKNGEIKLLEKPEDIIFMA